MLLDVEALPKAGRDPWRVLRYLIRTPMLLVHLLINLPITVALINPLSKRIMLGSDSLNNWVIRWWSWGLARVFGFRLKRFGTAYPGACLTVSNHASWLDIEMVHAMRVVHFVAKSEISRWPLVGWLARRAGTIYHQRGSSESLSSVSELMVQRLRQGHAVAVFPEGGTKPTLRVRTFHARIFQAARDAGVVVQPVALNFLRAGKPDPSVCFRDHENFLQNFLRLLGDPPRRAEVHFLPAIEDQGGGRRELSDAARHAIMHALGQQHLI
jgi:1-acyl-sn-glycerol-3-phosphate acyltransferase